jgi:cyanophycinase-like exopeptidase
MGGEVPGDPGLIYLTADSQPLLRAEGGRYPLLESVARALAPRPRAAYVGASNRDEPAFYQIFEAAMDVLQIEDRRMIGSAYDAGDRAFMAAADLILLAGGDVLLGWGVIEASGMRETLLARHAAGAALMGVSAGAMQLGLGVPAAGAESAGGLVATLGLVQHVVDVHAESDGWQRLRRSVAASRWRASGLGIPTGAAMVYRPDGSLDVLRGSIVELVLGADGVVERRRP